MHGGIHNGTFGGIFSPAYHVSDHCKGCKQEAARRNCIGNLSQAEAGAWS